jgi:hypothetical protein
MNELQRSPESRATPRSATRNASQAAWQQSKPNAKWGTSESLICLTLMTHNGTPPSRVSSKRQQGSRRPVDAVEPPPEQIFGGGKRYAGGNDHRHICNHKSRGHGRHAKKPAAILALVTRLICGHRMVMIGMICRLVIAHQGMNFLETMRVRRIGRQRNSGDRSRQGQQIENGGQLAHPSAPFFARKP